MPLTFDQRFGGANQPTVIKPEHLAAAAQSVHEKTRDRVNADLSLDRLSDNTEPAMMAIADAQEGHRNRESLTVDLSGLPSENTLNLLFVALVFAYRCETDCLDGLPPVVFWVRGETCQALQFLFRLVHTKEDVTLTILHDFLSLLLTQGGDLRRTGDWLPPALL